uniref:Uncharacterized protein n=1 Tax=Arundo donax TaxID=35708 RepID=A0A0A8Y8F9_ARUDO
MVIVADLYVALYVKLCQESLVSVVRNGDCQPGRYVIHEGRPLGPSISFLI